MTETRTFGRQVSDEVRSWPGIAAGPGRRGEYAFKLAGREIGHLHGDRSAHFSFPPDVWKALKEEGRIVEHPVFPDRVGPAARQMRSADDVRDVIELMRLNYERVGATGTVRAGNASGEAA